MTMPEVVPTLVLDGVPLSSPVAMLKLAQDGLSLIENEKALPAESVAFGWKLYAAPAITEVPGVPEIVGGGVVVAGGVVTLIENGGSFAVENPLLTEMTMFE